jgi:Glycerol dehydrogenase and related enzymes
MEACAAHSVTQEFTEVVLGIIVSTGLVSNFVQVDYTTGLAHAVYNGFTVIPAIEENHHLHGEVVAYGILVLLTADRQYEERDRVFRFNKSIGLPTTLADIHATKQDLPKVAKKALMGIDVRKYPYPVTEELIITAIMELEEYAATQK